MRTAILNSIIQLMLAVCLAGAAQRPPAIELDGLNITPHVQSGAMRYRRPPDPGLGILTQIFLRNTGTTPIVLDDSISVLFRQNTPSELLQLGQWSWHDTPSAWVGQPLLLPPGAMTVWTFNSKGTNWGVGTHAPLSISPGNGIEPVEFELTFAEPRVWLSAMTFLGSTSNIHPDSMVFHVANETGSPFRLESCRLWLPATNQSWRALHPGELMTRLECFPANGIVPPGDRGGARVHTGSLPLTYAAVEVRLSGPAGKLITLWAHQRIKREVFDISGGWVASKLGTSNTLHCAPYLKTLRRMHVNTGHLANIAGYTDQTGPDGLYTRYPLKYFNKLEPFENYDTDAMLPRIHAVEFLGEPQYGGGRPVPPQEVWEKLAPYQATRMSTSVTHSEERIWRYYAGLSDFPHFDAYRVTSPAPDAWSKYDRWDGRTIRWGAPLETIGDMSRSLRELNRPRPIAYWSQGPNNWESYGGRQRTSPTPDELRAQAYHALSSRITSIYWFNLSLKSLLKFPDLMEPITRVNREIRMLGEFYLEGDATSHERLFREGKPDWDLDVVAGPRGALLFALDLAYTADAEERVFKFAAPREAKFRFRLPSYVGTLSEVFRVDSDGTADVDQMVKDGILEIHDRASRVAIYVVATAPGTRANIEARRRSLLSEEESLGFNPGQNPADLTVLKSLLRSENP